MQNVFIVESPLQMLNAIEARKYFDILPEQAVLLVLSGVSHVNVEQIRVMVRKDDWRSVHFVPGSHEQSFLYTLFPLNAILRRYPRPDRVFFGEFRSPFMRHAIHCLQPREAVLLDDGTETLFVEDLLKQGDTEATWKDHLKRRIFGFKTYPIEAFTYFTVYEFETSAKRPLIKNEYSFLRTEGRDARRTEDVLFLGTCSPEVGIIDGNLYFRYLHAIKDMLAPAPMVYIPHRREDPEKLRRIAEMGIEVRFLETCIEHDMISRQYIPKVLASFFCSALPNCKQIYGSALDVVAFRIKSKHLNNSNVDQVLGTYDAYRKFGFTGFDIVEIGVDE